MKLGYGDVDGQLYAVGGLKLWIPTETFLAFTSDAEQKEPGTREQIVFQAAYNVEWFLGGIPVLAFVVSYALTFSWLWALCAFAMFYTFTFIQLVLLGPTQVVALLSWALYRVRVLLLVGSGIYCVVRCPCVSTVIYLGVSLLEIISVLSSILGLLLDIILTPIRNVFTSLSWYPPTGNIAMLLTYRAISGTLAKMGIEPPALDDVRTAEKREGDFAPPTI